MNAGLPGHAEVPIMLAVPDPGTVAARHRQRVGAEDQREAKYDALVVAWRDVLRWQFDLAWSLLELHLNRLEPGDFLWQPAPVCFTVRPTADGVWVADWADPEPDPPPNPTIAWVIWHIGWWWTVTIEHAHGRTPPDRSDVTWPGDGAAAVAWLRSLRPQWLAALDQLSEADLEAIAPFPWQNNPERTVAHMVAWVNAELMKNAAEIGQLRLLRAAI